MYKVVKLGNNMYAKEFESLSSILDEIEEHVDVGEPVILVKHLHDVEYLCFDHDEIETIE